LEQRERGIGDIKWDSMVMSGMLNGEHHYRIFQRSRDEGKNSAAKYKNAIR